MNLGNKTSLKKLGERKSKRGEKRKKKQSKEKGKGAWSRSEQEEVRYMNKPSETTLIITHHKADKSQVLTSGKKKRKIKQGQEKKIQDERGRNEEKQR